MRETNCAMMELHCLERARSEPLNRGKWIAQAERWHELARAQNSWRFQEKPFQPSLQADPAQTECSNSSFHPLKNESPPSSSDLAKSNYLELE